MIGAGGSDCANASWLNQICVPSIIQLFRRWKYFCNFLYALAQWCFIWFYSGRLPISSWLQISFFQNYPSVSPRSLSLHYDVTYWKHSLTIATSLESNCSPPALLARHTRSNASLSSWGNIWLGGGGQGGKKIRALKSTWTQPRK